MNKKWKSLDNKMKLKCNNKEKEKLKDKKRLE